jgi:hypothetical protein
MVRSEAKSGASISNCAPRCRHSAGGTKRNASSKRPVMRKKPICSARASLRADDRRSSSMTRRSDSEYVKERFDLEAAQVTRQSASTQIRGLPVVHVLPPDEHNNTPIETTNSKHLTSMEKTALAAGITERKYRHFWHGNQGDPSLPALLMSCPSAFAR